MSQAAPSPLLELHEVATMTQGYEVLRGASCSFKEGRTAFIMGTSGAGKSTLIKVAAGLSWPDSGSVLYRGRALGAMNKRELADYYKAYGFAFQDSALWANQSIGENLSLPIRVIEPRIKPAELQARVRGVLSVLGYDESLSQRPAQLSLGEQKIISIARAMVVDPSILFMDEPTAFLDDASLQRVMRAILDYKRRGRTVIVVTHSAELAFSAADDLVVVHQGRVVAQGDFDELSASDDAIVQSVLRRSARHERQYNADAPSGGRLPSGGDVEPQGGEEA